METDVAGQGINGSYRTSPTRDLEIFKNPMKRFEITASKLVQAVVKTKLAFTFMTCHCLV